MHAQQRQQQPSARIAVACPAKVNLALSVGSPRDDGYHPIASWMVAVDFHDDLEVERAGGLSQLDIRFADDAPRAQPIDWPIEKDLSWRAHRLLETHVGRALPIRAVIRKRIPTGAGLGGGSSNAAGMIVALNQLFQLGLAEDELIRVGTEIGCDVAFLIAALHGRPSVIATGLGEQLTAAPPAGIAHFVLVFPPIHCPTAPVYAAFDDLRGRGATVDERAVRDLASRSPVPPDGPFNDLTGAALDAVAGLRDAVQTVREAMDAPVHMSGSGSALFAIAPDHEAATTMAQRITERTGFPAVAARTLS